MSTLRVDNINARTGTTISAPSGTTVYLPGHVIQVVNTFYKTPASLSIPGSYNTYTNVPGISASITPKNANSKIYMTIRWFGEFAPTSMTWEAMFSVTRNGTVIGQPDPNGSNTLGIHMAALSYWAAGDADSTPETCFFDYYDSPATTSALTYQLCIASYTGGTMYVNRCVNATTSGSYERGTSSITLFEIAG